MTTVEETSRSCPACGVVYDAIVCASTSSFGSSDLDCRPAPPARDAFVYDVAACPECGLAWPTVDEPDKDLRADPMELRQIVASPEYRECLNTEAALDAAPFLAAAFVLERLGRSVEAGWFALSAAWIADDDERPADARAARLRAGEIWLAARSNGEVFMDDPSEEACMLADVYRRAGWFSMARYQADLGQRADLASEMRELLNCEARLASAQDSRLYTAEEAPRLALELVVPGGYADAEEQHALMREALNAARAKLPCPACGARDEPDVRKPTRGSAEWWDDPAAYIGCGACGTWLLALPDIYPAGWPDPNQS
jgi:hypothetical protein